MREYPLGIAFNELGTYLDRTVKENLAKNVKIYNDDEAHSVNNEENVLSVVRDDVT